MQFFIKKMTFEYMLMEYKQVLKQQTMPSGLNEFAFDRGTGLAEMKENAKI